MARSYSPDPSIVAAQRALLRELFLVNGGPTKITQKAHEVGLNQVRVQSIVNWRQRGAVPLEYIPRLAKMFKVSEYALNYPAVSMQKGSLVSFADAVDSCKALSPEIRRSIIATAREGLRKGRQK